MNEAKVIRILIVDDSATIRGMWNRILSAQPDINVIGAANDGIHALSVLNNNEVDLVLLDIEMPEMDGLTALPLILQQNPNVRVIIASALTSNGSKATIQALTSGAADYVSKPSTTSLMTSVGSITKELLEKIRSLQYFEGNVSKVKKTEPETSRSTLQTEPRQKGEAQIVVIGSSTGGPNALMQVIKRLSPDFTLPIVIVQHMPAYFITALGESLMRTTGRPCFEIKNGDQLHDGCIYLAPGDLHAEFTRTHKGVILYLNDNPPENFCRPAVDPMFRSAAKVFGKNLIAVILTGMGEDGKKGCEEIRRQGGWIIAQDQETSVVWGMPGAVVQAGLADAVLPLESIADKIQNICGKRVVAWA